MYVFEYNTITRLDRIACKQISKETDLQITSDSDWLDLHREWKLSDDFIFLIVPDNNFVGRPFWTFSASYKDHEIRLVNQFCESDSTIQVRLFPCLNSLLDELVVVGST